jgi:hypothetical protein
VKKDIIFHQAHQVHIAIIQNEDTLFDLYLINQNQTALRNILINTNGEKPGYKSSTLRYFLERLEEFSYIKFESVMQDVMELNNSIMLSYYIGMDIFEKEFLFTYEQLINMTPQEIPLIKQNGYLL